MDADSDDEEGGCPTLADLEAGLKCMATPAKASTYTCVITAVQILVRLQLMRTSVVFVAGRRHLYHSATDTTVFAACCRYTMF